MRKTNLFYSQTQDSSFITFSNYTEALTGNLLSTDCKMFPSKFICIYLPSLDGYEMNEMNELVKKDDFDYTEAKANFISHFLSAYYENKLAAIRDWSVKANIEHAENIISPLDYLLSTIKKFDPLFDITFIGDICEQDYNGTFMDNLCIIENNASAQTYEYIERPITSDTIDLDGKIEGTDEWIVPIEYKQKYPDWKHKLYGWAGANVMPTGYDEVEPIYDIQENGVVVYYYGSDSIIRYKHIYEESGGVIVDNGLAPIPESIKFNILIPLFDVFQFNKFDESNVVYESKYDDKAEQGINEEEGSKVVLVNNSEYKNQYDVPLGMWFSDKVVELERTIREEGQTRLYRPSWSLCISSQFKPFPYTDKYPNEIEEYSNPDKFASFALIMSKQAFILDEFNKLNENYANLANEVKRLETKLRILTESGGGVQ